MDGCLWGVCISMPMMMLLYQKCELSMQPIEPAVWAKHNIMSSCFTVNNTVELMCVGIVKYSHPTWALITESVCVRACSIVLFPLYLTVEIFKGAWRTQPAFVNMNFLKWCEKQVGLFVCKWSFISMLCLITFTALRQGFCKCVCQCFTCVFACLPADGHHIAPWKTYTLTSGEWFPVQSKYSSYSN